MVLLKVMLMLRHASKEEESQMGVCVLSSVSYKISMFVGIFFFLLFSTAVYAQVDTPISSYNFETDCTDQVNDRDCFITNGTAHTTIGALVGVGAFNFDGVNDVLISPLSYVNANFSSGFTVCNWARFNSISGPDQMFSIGGLIVTLTRAGPKVSVITDGGGGGEVQSTQNLVLDHNYFFCQVYDGSGTADLYIDGELNNSDTGKSDPDVDSVSDRSVCFGGGTCWGSGGEFFNGTLDQIMIYDVALDASDIDFLWNGGVGRDPTAAPEAPSFSTVVNNATILTTTGDHVNWTTTITDAVELSFCWFSHNDSGTFVNSTVQSCTTPFVFDETITLAAGIGDEVCGFFKANNTANLHAQTSNSCFTLGERVFPQFSNASNNASINVINDVVKFSINITDNFALGSWTFGDNGSGSFTNISLTFFNGETAVNLSVNQTIPDTPNKFVCGRFYFNDTSGNENSSQSCFTTSNLFRVNLTAFNARTNVTINSFTASITGITDISFFTTSTTTTGLIQISLASGNYSVITNATTFSNGTGFINVTAPTNASFSMFPDPSSISLTILREGSGSLITQRV
ncbi:hypothetical protein LCGC14_1889880, partial [marine sediment metagenome]